MWLSILLKLIPLVLKTFGITKPLWLDAVAAVAAVEADYSAGKVQKDNRPDKWYIKVGNAIYSAAGNSQFVTNLVRELAVLAFRNK